MLLDIQLSLIPIKKVSVYLNKEKLPDITIQDYFAKHYGNNI
jgi:hypothetical protein